MCMNVFVVLLWFMAHVWALKVTVSHPPQPQFFDLCKVCAPGILTEASPSSKPTTATMLVTATASSLRPRETTSMAPVRLPFGCNAPNITRSVYSLCGIGKFNPLHVIRGSRVPLVVSFTPERSAHLMEIWLRVTLSNGTQWKASGLADQRNASLFPANVAFDPRDRGHNSFQYIIQIPSALNTSSIVVKGEDGTASYVNQSYFSLVYSTYNATASRPLVKTAVIRNLTIDTTSMSWVFAAMDPAPEPVASISTSANFRPQGHSDKEIVEISVGAVSAALILLVAGFLIIRRMRPAPVGTMPEQKSSKSLDAKISHELSILPYPVEVVPRIKTPVEDPDLSDEETSPVVFKRVQNGSFAASLASRNSHSNSITSSGRSTPKSILKTQEMVQAETLNAHMYDPIIVTSYQRQPPSTQRNRDVLISSSMSKRVMFKDTVETAIVDLSLPPALNAIPGASLFDDSEDGSVEFENVDDDSDDQLHFNDGGVEKDIKKLLGRVVDVDDDEEEYDSETEDNDDWRKEQQ
ncbi:hypothetical protein BC830DRAFT_1154848 [Chytriomyces sp. MP71]|nr:hypothetical protein BC830DRAFT_1154848 [Chytriomyces sp. MP71]